MKQVSDARGSTSSEEKERPSVEGRKLVMVRAAAVLRHPHLVEMRASAADAEARPRLSDAGTRLGIGARTPDAFEPNLDGGVRLSELCKSRFGSGPMPLSFGLRILLDALSGVAALHATGFAHGELAPCNIVVARDGTGRLIPVVASHWKEGAPPSSDASGFAAPERLRGDTFDHRADVFSAGVMLWEMITGHSFRGLPPETITAWVVDGKIPDPVHPDDAPWVVRLGRVAMRAIEVNASDRWPHVGVIGAEIEYVAEGHIASSKEVTELLADASEAKAPVSKSDSPFTPSLSPTAVSIPPVPIPAPPLTPTFHAAPAAPAVVIAPPMSERPASMARPVASRRRQSLIAWSTLLLALGLLGLAAHELFENSGMLSRGAPVSAPPRAAAPAAAPPPMASPAVPSPAAPSPAAPVASNQTSIPAVAPPAADPPKSLDKAALAAKAPAAPRAPAPKAAPSKPAAKPASATRSAPGAPVPKNPKFRDETFGI